MMRILWLSHLLPWPPKGGLSQRSYHLMREVGQRADLHVVAFWQRAHQANAAAVADATRALEAFSTLHAVHALPENTNAGGRIGLVTRSLLPGPPYTIRWGMSRAFARSVRATIHKIRPDIVHFDTISLAPYLDEVGDTPAVLNHHNIESHMLTRRAEQETRLLRRLFFRQEAFRLLAYERDVARRFALHLTCSELDAERLRASVGPVPTSVIPNGVDLGYFRPADPERANADSLVFVGGLSWYPNAGAIRFFLREVWPLLSARRPSTQLTVVGRGVSADLAAIAAKDSRIRFPGFVDDMRPVVHEAAVYICPIRDGGGTKLKMLDAMALGKPIVAHPVACEGLGLTHGENVVHAETPEGFTEEICRLFDDAALRRRIGTRARQHVERHFSFEAIGAELVSTYAAVMHEAQLDTQRAHA